MSSGSSRGCDRHVPTAEAGRLRPPRCNRADSSPDPERRKSRAPTRRVTAALRLRNEPIPNLASGIFGFLRVAEEGFDGFFVEGDAVGGETFDDGVDESLFAGVEGADFFLHGAFGD